MKIIQYILIIFCLSILTLGKTTAQNLDYEDDVYPVVKSQPKEISYPILFKFQKQVPYHANAYFQLGLIFKEWAMEYDPFTDYDIVQYFINQSETYLGLCLNNLDKKEARKHGEFYQGAKKQDGNWWHKPADIKKVIFDHRAELRKYKQNITQQRKYLLKSVQKYDHCINLFREINTRYDKIKDIYLKADKQLLSKIDELERSFDSTLIFFDLYRKALNDYPIKDYDQNYSLAKINTYHLQGITDANFLANDIVLWDFKSWVKDFYKVINNDIMVLRQKIKEADISMDGKLNEAKFNPLEAPYSYDRKLAFMVNKFDYQSMIIDLFNYKTSKINFLSYYNRPFNNASFNKLDETYRKKSVYYRDLIAKKIQTDSLLDHFESKLSEDEAEKYQSFINTKYGGYDMLDAYPTEEQNDNDEYMKKSYQNLLASLIKNTRYKLSDTLLKYDNKNMKLQHCMTHENDTVYGYKPLSIKQYQNHYFIAGYLDDSVQNDQAFFAKMDTSYNVVWMKELGKEKTQQTRAMEFDFSQDTIVTLVHQVDTQNNEAGNFIYKLDHWGNLHKKIKLKQKRQPAYLVYDDLNQTLMMAFQGLSIDTIPHELDSLKFVHTTSNTDSLIWKNTFYYNGNLVDIVKMDLEYLVFCNYSKYKNLNGEITKNPFDADKPTASLALSIDKTGRTRKIIPYESSEPHFILKAEKLNSEEINLQGIQQEYFNIRNEENQNNDLELYYSILNSKGEETIRNP